MDQKLISLTEMSRGELLSIRPGTYADGDLLAVADYFTEQDDEDRQFAAIELLLSSPLLQEDVEYSELYLSLTNYYVQKEEFDKVLRWSLIALAYEVQAGDHLTYFSDITRNVCQSYLLADKPSIGLGMITRLIERNPSDVWTYILLATALVDLGLKGMAFEVIDRSLSVLKETGDPENLQSELLELREEAEESQPVSDADPEGVDAAVLAALRAALALPLPATPAESDDQYLPPLDRLIDLDRAGDLEVEAEILAAGPALIPELIDMAMDEDLQVTSSGPWHAARMLNRLRSGPAPELEALSNWLDRTDVADWQEWKTTAIVKVGGYTVDALEAMARDTTLDQMVWTAVLDEMIERIERQPELRPRLINLLRDMFNRPNVQDAEQEAFTAVLIQTAVWLNAAELQPEVEIAFAEDRVDKRMLDMAEVSNQFVLPESTITPRRSDGLYLWLTCIACERSREHFTSFVLINEPTLDKGSGEARGPYIIDHAFVCPKCGAVEQYYMPPIEIFRLMQLDPEQIADVLADRQPKKAVRPNPRVFYISEQEGVEQAMHPLDVIADLHRQIALQPDNGRMYKLLGDMLRILGRFEPSLDAYRKAVELAPKDTETLYAAASAEHDYGELENARRLYETCLEIGRVNVTALNYRLDQTVMTAMQGLKALDHGKASPWDYPLINASGKRLMPPAREGKTAGSAAKKDKRAKRHGKRH